MTMEVNDKIGMSDIIVNLDQGYVRGKQSSNYKGGTFYSFYGIPYAKPPLGNLRFKAPQPPEPWIGIWDGTIERNGCISRNTYTKKVEGSEDCLHLNVYTHNVRSKPDQSSNLTAVLVYVHGGGFMSGNTKTELLGPNFLLTQNIVLVTVCYRFGALGFSYLEDSSLGVSGNHGIRDVLMALKWVQMNIATFCGNPNNVTLCGSSCGAAMAHFIMLSPLGNGLFHRLILHSGCALNFWSTGRKDSLKELAKVLNFNSDNDKEVLDFLIKQPVEVIFEAQQRVQINSFKSLGFPRHFFPIIEDASSSVIPIISENPKTIIAKGRYSKVPIVIGYTMHEGLHVERVVRRTLSNSGAMITAIEDLVLSESNFIWSKDVSHNIIEKIKEFYFDGEDPKEEHIRNCLKIPTDLLYAYPIQIAIKEHLRTMSCPVYFFKFAFDGKLNLFRKLQGAKLLGASHSDDICYLFKMSENPEVEENSIEDITIQRMVQIWANVAKTGNPNHEGTGKIADVKWDPVEKDIINALHINEELSIETDPDKNCIDFWEEIFHNDSPPPKL